jgi:HNH endonuclease
MRFSDLAKGLRNRIYIEPNTGCWLWLGWCDEQGYGRLTKHKPKHTSVLAHRLIWEHLIGPAPEQVHHRCLTKSCCNPSHLEATTRLDHKKQHHRSRTCNRGHDLTLPGATLGPASHHGCRICFNARARQRYWKAKHEQSNN